MTHFLYLFSEASVQAEERCAGMEAFEQLCSSSGTGSSSFWYIFTPTLCSSHVSCLLRGKGAGYHPSENHTETVVGGFFSVRRNSGNGSSVKKRQRKYTSCSLFSAVFSSMLGGVKEKRGRRKASSNIAFLSVRSLACCHPRKEEKRFAAYR